MAPEIDGGVLVHGGAATGELVWVRIRDARGADLEAELLEREHVDRRNDDLDAYPAAGVSPLALKIAPQ